MSEPNLFAPRPKLSLPCGLYRLTQPLDQRLKAPLLVYFHNHGEPGPGVYPAFEWRRNKAAFAQQGLTVDAAYTRTMTPLPPEGFYRVKESFTCCEKNCKTFEPGMLVQLGYDGSGNGILFVPTWTPDGLSFPERGTRLSDDRLALLEPLKVVIPEGFEAGAAQHEGGRNNS
jgi:hypothetical protein